MGDFFRNYFDGGIETKWKVKGVFCGGEENSPRFHRGDRTKNKNYEQTLTLNILY